MLIMCEVGRILKDVAVAYLNIYRGVLQDEL
jgi:hypothetical protein